MGKHEQFNRDEFVVDDGPSDGTTHPFPVLQIQSDEEENRKQDRRHREEQYREFRRNDGFSKNDSVAANIIRLFSVGVILLSLALLYFPIPEENPIPIDLSLHILSIGCALELCCLWKKSYRRSLSRFLQREKNRQSFERWAKEMRSLLSNPKPFKDDYVAHYYDIFKAALTAPGYNEIHVGLLNRMTVQKERFLHRKSIATLAHESDAHVERLKENFALMEALRTG